MPALWIGFLAYARNADRQDRGCPFGCSRPPESNLQRAALILTAAPGQDKGAPSTPGGERFCVRPTPTSPVLTESAMGHP